MSGAATGPAARGPASAGQAAAGQAAAGQASTGRAADRFGTYLYPWDVEGDPAAADEVAALGVGSVSLAAAYHSVRAITPRHPRHRIVTAAHAAVYYPPDGRRWAGRRLRPTAQSWCAGPDPFGSATAALRRAGLAVHAWVVVLHNALLGLACPDRSVVSAHGDHYPWALCPSHEQVREYARDLAVEAAVRPGVDGIELESCGWYGFAHLSSHDKTPGVPAGGAADLLLSLCFCTACTAGYGAGGIDAARARGLVAAAVDRLLGGAAPATGPPRAPAWEQVEREIGADLAAALLARRSAVVAGLLAEVVAGVRAARGPGFPVLLHADPRPYRCGANVGVDAAAAGTVDGLVVSGPPDLLAAASTLCGPSGRVLANLPVVTGMGGDPAALPVRMSQAAAAGAAGFRFYHAGLAAAADLAAVGRAVSAYGGPGG